MMLNSRYEIISTLSMGGMSQTYIAEDTLRPGYPKCVVKKLHPHSQETEIINTLHRLFMEEANALEKLGTHDQIPRLLAYFSQDKEFYLIQEFIEGNPLSDELVPGQIYAEEAVLQILTEILAVLEFVHLQGVIHRDIKPENLIRRQVDQKLVLIDFGAVKRVQLPYENGSKQNITVSIGTPGYMPVEQIAGRPVLSSDLYAVGMIGIQALTGQYPQDLSQSSTGEVIWQPQTAVSSGLVKFLQRMTHPSHKHRYQTATDALQTLTSHVNPVNPTVRAVPKSWAKALTSPPSVPQRWRRQLSRWSKLIGLGTAVAIAAFPVGFWVANQNPSRYTWGDDNTLTVGVLATQYNPAEGYEVLTDYVETQLTDKLKIPVDVVLDVVPFDEPGAFSKAKEKIKAQHWDITFTTAPLVSATAVRNDYNFVARMFPNAPQFESAFFVRGDSPIKTLDDLNTSHTLALREVSSAAGFYLPVYDLYGKSVKADLNNPSFELIMRKVATGEADVGAIPYQILERLTDEQPRFRTIHRGRAIPLSGLYLSPQLASRAKTLLTQILLEAPNDLQQGAHYAEGTEIDYSEFLAIVQRVDAILGCANWEENPVQLFCETYPPEDATADETAIETRSIQGRVNGYSFRENAVYLTLQTVDQGSYRIVLPGAILDQDPGLSSLPDLAYKTVEVSGVVPESINGAQTLTITHIGQIRITN